MDLNTKEVFKRILDKKIEAVRKKVFEWDKQNLRNKKSMEFKDRVYLIFGEVIDNKIPSSLYVGKTRQVLDKRFNQHIQEIRLRLNGIKDWNIKYRWMLEMVEREQNIRIILLNKVQRSKVYSIENEWIYYLGMHNFNMINKSNFIHYNKKVYKI